MLESLINCGFLEVYTDGDDGKFDVGKLLKFDEDWLFLSCVDSYGNYDGYMLLRRENVFKINYGTQYLKRLTELMQGPIRPIKIPIRNLFNDVLKFVQKDYIVSLTLLNGNVIIGKIIETQDDKLLKIQIYLDNGSDDGVTIIAKDMISSVQFECHECLAIQKNIFFERKE